MLATFCVKMFGRSWVSSDADVALPAGLLVDLLRLLPLADDAADPPVADDHDELVDRRILRQREHVHRLDLLAERVLELLHHFDRGDVPADPSL